MNRKIVSSAICAVTLLAGAGTAHAGEVTGSGTTTPIASFRANSECSFSGLNDHPDPTNPFEGRVQSFGQYVKLLGPLGGIPGTACNGSST
jgi:hypothetical protein